MSIKSYVPQAINGNSEGTYKGMLETAIKVTAQAKGFTPVDLGELKGSLMWQSEKDKGGLTQGEPLTEKPGKDEVIVGTATEYGVYQEFGTRYMDAQPFLRPAVDAVTNGTNAEKAMAKAIRDSVSKRLPKV